MDNINPHFLYPISPEAIGDDYGEYTYARPAYLPSNFTLSGEPYIKLYVLDCWIVNRLGKIHPRYDEAPIPVRVEHLGNHVLPAKE